MGSITKKSSEPSPMTKRTRLRAAPPLQNSRNGNICNGCWMLAEISGNIPPTAGQMGMHRRSL